MHMVVGLITKEQEKTIFRKLTAYYKRLYPDIKFETKEKVLSKKEIGELYFTYPGEEKEDELDAKIKEIESSLPKYNTPAIILEKKKKKIILDGHRRLLTAYKNGVKWKALILISKKDILFGIEKIITGKLRAFFKN